MQNRAWIERSLRMLLGIRDLVVYTAKQFYDKMFGSHGILLSAFGLSTYSIGESPWCPLTVELIRGAVKPPHIWAPDEVRAQDMASQQARNG